VLCSVDTASVIKSTNPQKKSTQLVFEGHCFLRGKINRCEPDLSPLPRPRLILWLSSPCMKLQERGYGSGDHDVAAVVLLLLLLLLLLLWLCLLPCDCMQHMSYKNLLYFLSDYYVVFVSLFQLQNQVTDFHTVCYNHLYHFRLPQYCTF
jgi:hypothetical protein